MNSYLTEEEYTALRSRIESGDVSISIPRGVARQFFTHVSNTSIKGITDTSMFWPKYLVWLQIAFSALCLLGAVYFIIRSFGYWSTIAVPLIGIFWVILAGLHYENGSWAGITVLLAASFVPIYYMAESYSFPACLFVLSVWSYRTTYILAQTQLTSLVKESYAAFDMLVAHIVIHESDSNSAN